MKRLSESEIKVGDTVYGCAFKLYSANNPIKVSDLIRFQVAPVEGKIIYSVYSGSMFKPNDSSQSYYLPQLILTSTMEECVEAYNGIIGSYAMLFNRFARELHTYAIPYYEPDINTVPDISNVVYLSSSYDNSKDTSEDISNEDTKQGVLDQFIKLISTPLSMADKEYLNKLSDPDKSNKED